MTKINDLPKIAEDDDFTCEELASRSLEEFSDVWETAGNAVLDVMQRDTLEILEELDPEVAAVFKTMLSYLCLGFLTDRNKSFDHLTGWNSFNSSSEMLFPLWRKWHPPPEEPQA